MTGFFHISWGWILSTFIWSGISPSFLKTIFCWVKNWKEFLGDPVVKTLCSHCQGPGFNRWSGHYDSTKWVSPPKEKKELELTVFFQHFIFYFKKIYWGDNLFTILCCFQVYSKVNLLYIYPLFLIFFSYVRPL